MPSREAEPPGGAGCAKSVPVMSPWVSGRKETEKLQLALGARPEHGAPERTNCRGNAIERARDFAVRLLMVNWRVMPVEPVVWGPNWASLAMICRPVSSVV